MKKDLLSKIMKGEHIVRIRLDHSAFDSDKQISGKISDISGDLVTLNPFEYSEWHLEDRYLHARYDKLKPGETNREITINKKYIVTLRRI